MVLILLVLVESGLSQREARRLFSTWCLLTILSTGGFGLGHKATLNGLTQAQPVYSLASKAIPALKGHGARLQPIFVVGKSMCV